MDYFLMFLIITIFISEEHPMTKQIPVSTRRPMVSVLSDEQVKAIHNASLEILSQTGIDMQDPEGREILLKAGAWESDGRVKIPETMVKNAIANAPSRIPMHDRLGNLTMPLELGNVFFGSGSDTTFTLDVNTGERRRSTAQDVEDIACLSDALENIDFIMSMGNPSDVEPDDLYIHEFIRMMRGSTKPIVYTSKNRKDMEDIYRIAAAVVGGEQELREKPFLLLYAEPISPLLFPLTNIASLRSGCLYLTALDNRLANISANLTRFIFSMGYSELCMCHSFCTIGKTIRIGAGTIVK